MGWKVLGKFEGVGWEGALQSCGGNVGVKSAWKVRGKFVESSKEWAWKVRGKLEGVGVERSWKIGGCGREKVHSRYAGGRGCAKLMERLRRGTVMCLETSRVWLESAWVTVCGSVSWALTWVETLSQLEKVRRDAVGNVTVPFRGGGAACWVAGTGGAGGRVANWQAGLRAQHVKRRGRRHRAEWA